ncbi:hypothetical protein POM88_048595 [Heracleum sosnowskyi]|uniref:Uncharacterized protein n=1 Tax=Heracleum sosnowskyi TaxID=360622 RepID=A0AAD8M0M0_9APIA|nr:hypothetical protein POM88_048595 [Heracleum sosnowskyi]
MHTAASLRQAPVAFFSFFSPPSASVLSKLRPLHLKLGLQSTFDFSECRNTEHLAILSSSARVLPVSAASRHRGHRYAHRRQSPSSSGRLLLVFLSAVSLCSIEAPVAPSQARSPVNLRF